MRIELPIHQEPQEAEHNPEPESVRQVMAVEEAVALPQDVQVYRGKLLEPADRAYEDLKAQSEPNIVPLLQEDKHGRSTIVLMPRNVEQQTLEHRSRSWLHWLLFALTLITTTYAGARHQGVNLLQNPELFAVGLPYSLALMAILGCHELGHFFTARYYRMNVTPPYFIPVPFALGTFGAFIKMRSPSENRRSLFDVAIAGPLAGLVIAIPALYFGLKSSAIVQMTPTLVAEGSTMKSSILLAAMIKASLGNAVADGAALQLSPMAFAGWLGLMVTALNLLPIGQLDGGHITRAMFGTRTGNIISMVSMALLFLAAVTVAPGLMMWAFVVYFMAGRGIPPLNDVSKIGKGRLLLGLLALIILALIVIPMPEGKSAADGLTRSYL